MRKNKTGFPDLSEIEKFGSVVPDEWILKKLLESESLNVLMITGSDWDSAVKSAFSFLVLRTYCRHYDRNICLSIMGLDERQLERHRKAAGPVLRKYGVEDLVNYMLQPTREEVLACFLGCDVMLCFEDSKDMELPIAIAQYFHLPILAKDNPFTSAFLGRNQLLLSADPVEYAAGLHIIRDNQETARFLGNAGKEHYNFLKSDC